MGKPINELESGPNPYDALSREELVQRIVNLNSDIERFENDDAPDYLYDNLWLVYFALDNKGDK